MSREVRKVSADWVHPTDGHYTYLAAVRYIPLFDGSQYQDRLDRFNKEKAEWELGEYPSWADEEDTLLSFEEWDGEGPKVSDYMPVWTEEEKTHFMLYETFSEGTPQSPAFATVEELARWLVDNNATTFGHQTTTYENWLAFCKSDTNSGSCFALTPDGIVTGVDLASRK